MSQLVVFIVANNTVANGRMQVKRQKAARYDVDELKSVIVCRGLNYTVRQGNRIEVLPHRGWSRTVDTKTAKVPKFHNSLLPLHVAATHNRVLDRHDTFFDKGRVAASNTRVRYDSRGLYEV